MTDQEQAPFDLAEGERLLAAYKSKLGRQRRLVSVMHSRDNPEGPIDAYMWWLFDNGEAMVASLKAVQQPKVGSSTLDVCTCDAPHYQCKEHGAAVKQLRVDLSNEQSLVELARQEHNGFVATMRELLDDLQAAQQQYQIACDLVEQTEAERDAARADLVRVERQAETDNAWLLENGEALVATFKAANERAEALDKHLTAAIAAFNTDKAKLEDAAHSWEETAKTERAISARLYHDLARVEAERNEARELQEIAHMHERGAKRLLENAQARIAELEGSLRGLLTLAARLQWSGDWVERARTVRDKTQTPSAR